MSTTVVAPTPFAVLATRAARAATSCRFLGLIPCATTWSKSTTGWWYWDGGAGLGPGGGIVGTGFVPGCRSSERVWAVRMKSFKEGGHESCKEGSATDLMIPRS